MKYYIQSGREKYPTYNKKEGRLAGLITSFAGTVF